MAMYVGIVVPLICAENFISTLASVPVLQYINKNVVHASKDYICVVSIHSVRTFFFILALVKRRRKS